LLTILVYSLLQRDKQQEGNMKQNIIRSSNILSTVAVAMMITACSGTKSTTVVELTKYDKHMSCSELQMEITEATFLREKAQRNRGLNFKNIVMPLSYPSTYMSADEAIDAATNRVDYLSRLHEIKGCAAQGQYASADMGAGAAQMGYGQMMAAPAMPMQASPVSGYQEMRYTAQPMQVQQRAQGYEFTPQYAQPSYGY
jgi:hypothetical protein